MAHPNLDLAGGNHRDQLDRPLSKGRGKVGHNEALDRQPLGDDLEGVGETIALLRRRVVAAAQPRGRGVWGWACMG